MPVVGFLGRPRPRATCPISKASARAWVRPGYVEGMNVAVEYRWADDQLRSIAGARDRTRPPPGCGVVTGGSSPQPSPPRARLRRSPSCSRSAAILSRSASSPVNRPGGNVTGVSFLANVLVAKRLELLRTLVPGATAIGGLVNPNNPNASVRISPTSRSAARSLGLRFDACAPATEPEFDAAFAALAAQQAAALLVVPDALFTSARQQVAALAARHRLPTIYTIPSLSRGRRARELRTDITDALRQAVATPATSSRARSRPNCRSYRPPSSSS